MVRTSPEVPEAAEGEAPSDQVVMQTAVRIVKAQPAGLVSQPPGLAVVGVPQLAHATRSVQDASVEMFGRQVPVHMQALHYSFDFGPDSWQFLGFGGLIGAFRCDGVEGSGGWHANGPGLTLMVS